MANPIVNSKQKQNRIQEDMHIPTLAKLEKIEHALRKIWDTLYQIFNICIMSLQVHLEVIGNFITEIIKKFMRTTVGLKYIA